MRTIRKPKTNSRLRRFMVETLERREMPANFVPGNLVIYRAGDGAAALTSAATALFLDEYTTAAAQTMPVQSFALPTTGVNAFTGSGTSTSEGQLAASPDGQFVTVGGYNTNVGTASITSSNGATINRVAAIVDYQGNIDDSTKLTDFASGGNPRGVITTNGTDLWVSGSQGGARFTTKGSTTSTQLSTTTTNLRGLNIYNNQLYVSASSGATRVAAVGTGLPMISGQTITNLPGVDSTTVGSPYAFVLADLTIAVPGLDTLYVADDAVSPSSGPNSGIKKFSLVGGTWVPNGNIVLSGNGLRGLTGSISGTTVTLFGTSPTTLVSLTDTTGYNVAISGTYTTLATAATNTAFRGVAFVPQQAAKLATVNSLTAPFTQTTANTVTYTVTFSAAVNNLTASNFSLSTVGTVGGSISSVVGGGNNWTVTVSGITGYGTIRVDMANETGVTPPITNEPYIGATVLIAPATATLDAVGNTLVYAAGINMTNNATLSLSGGAYTINDTGELITITPAAAALGFNVGNGTNTVTGVGTDANVNAIFTFLGANADSFAVTGINDSLTVVSSGTAGSTANFPTSLVYAGSVSVSGFDAVTQTAGVVTVDNLTLGGGTIGTSGSPIFTKSINVNASVGAGGMYVTENDGGNFTLAASGVGTINIVNTTGTLTIGGNSTFGSGAVSLKSGDGVAINAALGDFVSSGPVAVEANTDSAGSEGFSMSSSGSVRTLDDSAAAFSLIVNTIGGGTGDATVNNIQTGPLGTATIDANAGSILGTATNVIFAGGGFGFLGSITLKTSGASSSIGTSGQHLILKTGNVAADAGTGGIYLDNSNTSQVKVGHLIAQGAGNILLARVIGGSDVQISGLVNTGSGSITLQADDNLAVLFTGAIGDVSYSGKIHFDVNMDGQNQQTYSQAAGTQVQTTSMASDAVVIFVTSSTNSTAAGGATLGNIKVGPSGGITVDVAHLLMNATDTSRAGFIEMVDNISVLDTGVNGTITLIAKDNFIGKSGFPILATCGTISANTNSVATSPLVLQQDADVFVVTTGAANFSGSTTDAGTHIGDLSFTTQAGAMTLNGDVKTDTGNLNLNSAAGIDQTSGKLTTLGNATFSDVGLARFATVGNSAASLLLVSSQDLRIDGGLTLTNPINIDGVLSGSGTLTAKTNVTALGKVAPGTSPGKLTTGEMALVTGSEFVVELNGNVPGTNYDQLQIVGTIDLGGTRLVGSVGGIIPPGATLIIVDNDTNVDPVSGKFVDNLNVTIPEGATLIIGATTFTITYMGGDGNDVALKAAGVATPPPTVTNLQIDDGSIQRSMIRSLTVTFSESVVISGATVDAFQLNRDSTPPAGPNAEQGGVTGLVNLAAVQAGNTVTITFLTSGANPINGVFPPAPGANAGPYSLPDGRYTLTIDASKVTGAGGKLDGDGNMTGGDNYVLASAASPSAPNNIFRFFGDVTGDGAVAGSDFNGTGPAGTPPNVIGFKSVFNGSDARFDYDQDGSVSAYDFVRFRFRFNGSVP